MVDVMALLDAESASEQHDTPAGSPPTGIGVRRLWNHADISEGLCASAGLASAAIINSVSE